MYWFSFGELEWGGGGWEQCFDDPSTHEPTARHFDPIEISTEFPDHRDNLILWHLVPVTFSCCNISSPCHFATVTLYPCDILLWYFDPYTSEIHPGTNILPDSQVEFMSMYQVNKMIPQKKLNSVKLVWCRHWWKLDADQKIFKILVIFQIHFILTTYCRKLGWSIEDKKYRAEMSQTWGKLWKWVKVSHCEKPSIFCKKKRRCCVNVQSVHCRSECCSST